MLIIPDCTAARLLQQLQFEIQFQLDHSDSICKATRKDDAEPWR